MNGIVAQGNGLREYFICGGQIIFQGAVLLAVNRNKLWDYLGNMMTISFAGTLFLAIITGIGGLIHLTSIVYTLFFLLTAGLMLLEHMRRCKLLDLGWKPSATWILYRVFVLVLILIAVI